MLTPAPLFFQAPKKIVMEALMGYGSELSPDFLCFEEFYQAVALSWPKEMRVMDIGGYMGVQGWLFKDFRHYVCVDMYELRHKGIEIPVAERCELPHNGLHVICEGVEFIRPFFFDNVDTSNAVFVCSAVPDAFLRKVVTLFPNHVVWYPGHDMEAAGPYAEQTIDTFNELCASDWRKNADKLILDTLNDDPNYFQKD